MKNEDNILSRCGNRVPFTVPEGYFENLTENIMAALPEQTVQKEQPRIITPWARIRPYMYAAAAFLGVLFLVRVASYETTDMDRSMAQTEDIYYSDEYIDEFLETVMVDDYTLYYSFIDFN
ncbi:MAG: hypothetical protein J6V02_05850 [Bacteroidaceae bacterium]|nr:hypothetical protein [Bacteroidaceae bacterium]